MINFQIINEEKEEEFSLKADNAAMECCCWGCAGDMSGK